MEKYSAALAFNRVTMLTIDQVRANLVIDPYAQKEKTVGVFKDHKAATSIASFNHRVSQWLFLSKKEEITPKDGLGINGWKMNMFTEKNKRAPSKETITCVFDKRTGLHKFWSEYVFLSEMMPSEYRYYKTENKLPYPLSIKGAGAYSYLEFIDPTSGSTQYKSDNFYMKNAYEKYQSDEAFRKAFDYVMDVAVEYRINKGLFSMSEIQPSNDENIASSVLEDSSDLLDVTASEENNAPEEEEETYQSIF